jgi:exocyst complex protein 7
MPYLHCHRPDKAGLSTYFGSLKRIQKALRELNATSLKSNQQAIADLDRLLKMGTKELEKQFERVLMQDARAVEPLQYLTKEKPFPLLHRDKTTRLGLIVSFIDESIPNRSQQDPTLAKIYAKVRGNYLTSSLQNLALASVNTSKKKTPDAVYRQGTNGIGTYATGIEGMFLAEYDNICALFSRDEWGNVFNLTCQGAMFELSKTLKELNLHIKANLTTDCYLAYEIIEIVSGLSSRLDGRTGQLKAAFASALKPIRDTGKSSLAELLEDTRRRIGNMQSLPGDAGALLLTTDTMTRLQTMVDFLRPISTIMISLGDGNWKSVNASKDTSDAVPSLKSFDVGADGKQLFAHYSTDTIDALISSLEQKARAVLKGKSVIGAFLGNNIMTVERMIRNSDLQPLLASRMSIIDSWRKKAVSLYLDGWRDPPTHLLDVQYTNRGNQRPPSGSAALIDSAAILKGLSNKDKDAIKEKFRLFNITFDECVARHKIMNMDKEVRGMLAREVQHMIEPLYARFWDRYHEVDKKGKYVKYDKASISSIFLSLA